MTRNQRNLLAATLVLSAATAAFAQVPPGVPLRFVTMNMLDGIGAAGTARHLEFGKFLTILDVDGSAPTMGLLPDFLALQELEKQLTNDTVNLAAFRDTYLPGYAIYEATGDGFNYNAMLVRPGITVNSFTNFYANGPRRIVKLVVTVPGAAKQLVVYSAHFKCCGDPGDLTTRTNEARASGVDARPEMDPGAYPALPFPDPLNRNVVFMGDLNSNNNFDDTITGVFLERGTAGVPTGLQNFAVETLFGRLSGSTVVATFPPSSRLDYICPDFELAEFFDADMSGTYDQAEVNSMGFVYYSNEDSGLRSSGDTNATNSYSDHRPVVMDLFLPRDPMVPGLDVRDVNQDGTVDTEDLQEWENRFVQWVPPNPSPAPDVDGSRNVDGADRTVLRTAVRSGEIAAMGQ